MIYKLMSDGRRVATSWRDDCFVKAVAEARRENQRDEFLSLENRWVGVYQDNTGRFSAIGIRRRTLAEMLGVGREAEKEDE